MAIGLASNNTALCVGCLGSDLILEAYCRDNVARLGPKQGSWASTYKRSLREKFEILQDRV